MRHADSYRSNGHTGGWTGHRGGAGLHPTGRLGRLVCRSVFVGRPSAEWPAVPADPSPLDMQISISGMDLFSTVDNTATANSGFGDIAIAIGNGANASATGFGDLSFADGTGSSASTGLAGLFDVALAHGDGSSAAGGLAGNFVHRQRQRHQQHRRGRVGRQLRDRQCQRRRQQRHRRGRRPL